MEDSYCLSSIHILKRDRTHLTDVSEAIVIVKTGKITEFKGQKWHLSNQIFNLCTFTSQINIVYEYIRPNVKVNHKDA